jgi:hypothetical protein
MAETNATLQTTQIGAEVTAGTAVAANKRLQAVQMLIRPQGNINMFRPQGFLYDTLQSVGKEFASGAIVGVPCYNALAFLLAGHFKNVAGVQQGATTAYLWTFDPSSTREDTVRPYTIENGYAVRAHKAAYGLIDGLGMTFNRERPDLSGDIIAQRLTDGITLTASPTDIDARPILPTHWDVYYDTTAAGLGGTKLTRCLEFGANSRGAFEPFWTLNTAGNASFAGHTKKLPTVDLSLVLEKDSNGMALLTDARAGTTKFLRLEAISSELAGTGFPFKLSMDFAVQVAAFPDFDDLQNLRVARWGLKPIHDEGWGKALTIALTNKIAVLT